MSSTFTPNLNLQLQGVGDNPSTWGTILNTNVFTIIDQALGSTYAVSVAGNSNVTLSNANAANLFHDLSGVLTGNIQYIFPANTGRFTVINNGTTGAYSVTALTAGGTGVVVPQGAGPQLVFFDSYTQIAYLGTASGVPSGTMLEYGGGTVPSGYLLCYGQAVSRTTYAALFAAISTLWGSGDGSTTFNLPDCRGRTGAGLDNMGGSSANRLTTASDSGFTTGTVGAYGGNQLVQTHGHTATVTDPAHTHTATVTDPTHQHGFLTSGNAACSVPTTSGGSSVGANNGNSNAYSPYTSYASTGVSVSNATNTTGITVANSTYGSGASQNVQPTYVALKMIKI